MRVKTIVRLIGVIAIASLAYRAEASRSARVYERGLVISASTRVSAVSAATGSFVVTYDGRGNIAEDDKCLYEYDAFDRLARVVRKRFLWLFD